MNKAKPITVGVWKFNKSLLGVKDFWVQLVLTIRELTRSVFRNKWYKLRIPLGFFFAAYNRQLNLDILAAQKH